MIMLRSWFGLRDGFLGISPCFIVRIVSARGVVYVRRALASWSWSPRPPRPEGVVAMYHAWFGSDEVVLLLGVVR